MLGGRPQVGIRLDTAPSAEPVEPAAGSYPASTGSTLQRKTSDAGGLAKAAVKQPAGKNGKVADYVIKFDRLLLNKTDTQAFTISNTGVLPFKWRLAGAAQLPAEFKVQPSEGELAARSKVQVTVAFNALKKQELFEMMTLEVCGIIAVTLTVPSMTFGWPEKSLWPTPSIPLVAVLVRMCVFLSCPGEPHCCGTMVHS